MSRSIVGRGLAAGLWIAAVALAPDAPSRIVAAVAVVAIIVWMVVDLAAARRA